MVNQIRVPQAKYELLNTINSRRSRCNRVVCLTIPLLTIGLLLLIAGIWLDVQGVLVHLEEKVLDKVNCSSGENAEIIAWTRRARMYAESAKENQNADRNSTIGTSSFIPPIPDLAPYIVCYYTVPGSLNTSGNLSPPNIDASLCTHIIVGFASVVKSILFPGSLTATLPGLTSLKLQYPNLKILVSVGGMNEVNSGFPEMVKTHMTRKLFINSVLTFIKTWHLDGLDVDWEFPAWLLGDKDRERIYFVQLLQELKMAFDKSSNKFILSAAVAAPSAIIDESYDVPQIAQQLDFINLMAYDYHYYIWYLPITGLNAPLYSSPLDVGYAATLNVNYSAFYWIQKGMPREKIVIGIPTYGHSFMLYNDINHGIMAPAKGYGKLGHMGFVNYNDICEFIKAGASKVFDEDSRTPYAYKNDEWISFDDQVSIMEKVEWIKMNKFRGAMILSLNADDWNGTCYKNETFPLTRIVANNIMESRDLSEIVS